MAETLAEIHVGPSSMERSSRQRTGRSLTVASTSAEPALGPNDSDLGLTVRFESVQVGSSPWETGTPRRPTVSVPDRASPGFHRASTSIVFPPDTLAGVVIHAWSALTIQLQSLRPFTVTSCVPPAPPKDTGFGDTRSGEGGHGGGGGSGCVTVNVAPATVRGAGPARRPAVLLHRVIHLIRAPFRPAQPSRRTPDPARRVAAGLIRAVADAEPLDRRRFPVPYDIECTRIALARNRRGRREHPIVAARALHFVGLRGRLSRRRQHRQHADEPNQPLAGTPNLHVHPPPPHESGRPTADARVLGPFVYASRQTPAGSTPRRVRRPFDRSSWLIYRPHVRQPRTLPHRSPLPCPH